MLAFCSEKSFGLETDPSRSDICRYIDHARLVAKRADVYVVVSPPLLLGAAAWFVTRLKRAPFVFYVKDLNRTRQ